MDGKDSYLRIQRYNESRLRLQKTETTETYLRIGESDYYLSADPTPQNLTATIIDETTVALDWDDLPAAFDSYNASFTVFARNTVSGEIEQSIDGIQLSEAEVMGLTELEEYEFWVATVINDYESAESNHVLATPEQQQPDAPQNFNIEVQDNLHFDGEDDYVNLGQLGNFGSQHGALHTIEVRFQNESTNTQELYGAYQNSITDGIDTGQILSLSLNRDDVGGYTNDPGKITVYTRDDNGNGRLIASTTNNHPEINDGNERHIAVRYDKANGIVDILLDGVSLDVTYVTQKTSTDFIDWNIDFLVGAMNDNRDGSSGVGSVVRPTSGRINEFRIWKGLRTHQQIQDNLDKKLDPSSEPDLFAYYPIDEGTGSTITDEAGDNTGTINGASWQKDAVNTWDEVAGVDGYNLYLKRPDYALEFDGVDDYVNIPHQNNYQAQAGFTVEGWLKRKDLSTGDVVLTKRGTNDNSGWEFRVRNNTNGNGVRVTFFGVNNYDFVTTISDTNWHHLAFTIDNSFTIRLYVDGVFKEALSASQPIDGDGDVLLGALLTGGTIGAFYPSVVDELRIWNTLRTSTQIANSYNKTLHGNESELVAYYPMIEGQGSTIKDQAGSNDGTINGASWTTVGQTDYQKENTSLIPTPEYTIEDLPDGDYEAYVTSFGNNLESNSSNIEVFTV